MKPWLFLLWQNNSLAHGAAVHSPNLIAAVVVFKPTPGGKGPREAPPLHSVEDGRRQSSAGWRANVLKSLPEKSNL